MIMDKAHRSFKLKNFFSPEARARKPGLTPKGHKPLHQKTPWPACSRQPCQQDLASKTSGALLQLRVQLLQGVHLQVIHVAHALHGRLRARNGGEGGHPSEQGRGANLP